MDKLLFVNGCIRQNSRSERLARKYLDFLRGTYAIEEVRVCDEDVPALDAMRLSARDADCASGNLSGDKYSLARQFSRADRIVIAAPYWDCLFPARLRMYLENICVSGLTIAYGENGRPKKLCRARTLTYITTAGGFLNHPCAVEMCMREMCAMFAIEGFEFYAAEGLDVFPDRVEELMQTAVDAMQKKFAAQEK